MVIGLIDLVLADCRDFLPGIKSNSVDLVLTDPPYVISRKTNFGQGKPTGRDVDRFRVSMEFGQWDETDIFGDVVKELYRVLRPGGTLICFYDIWKLTTLKEYLEAASFKQLRLIEWQKTNPVPLNSRLNYLTNAREVAVSAVKGGKPTFHSEYDNGVYRFPICHDKGRFHSTQKPVALMEALIRKHSNEGDLVLDCFAGSGSTAAAAHNLGRDFVGCEISEEYYQKAQAMLTALV